MRRQLPTPVRAANETLAVVAGRPWGLAFVLLALANTAPATADRRGCDWIGKLGGGN
ncbi:hypothetical protein ACFZB9_29460 [Kitasatospora sp. NPDC008050]|uniref:hypothetical protein n=1 Tax=Kitasatospora sp. NPDC008050 TaxID=3364021 RepID=UPI0036E45140